MIVLQTEAVGKGVVEQLERGFQGSCSDLCSSDEGAVGLQPGRGADGLIDRLDELLQSAPVVEEVDELGGVYAEGVRLLGGDADLECSIQLPFGMVQVAAKQRDPDLVECLVPSQRCVRERRHDGAGRRMVMPDLLEVPALERNTSSFIVCEEASHRVARGIGSFARLLHPAAPPVEQRRCRHAHRRLVERIDDHAVVAATASRCDCLLAQCQPVGQRKAEDLLRGSE